MMQRVALVRLTDAAVHGLTFARYEVECQMSYCYYRHSHALTAIRKNTRCIHEHSTVTAIQRTICVPPDATFFFTASTANSGVDPLDGVQNVAARTLGTQLGGNVSAHVNLTSSSLPAWQADRDDIKLRGRQRRRIYIIYII